jgi:hypothetical protein
MWLLQVGAARLIHTGWSFDLYEPGAPGVA